MSAMVLEICRFYPGLPDVRTLSMDEIEYFYDGARAQLLYDTKPRPNA